LQVIYAEHSAEREAMITLVEIPTLAQKVLLLHMTSTKRDQFIVVLFMVELYPSNLKAFKEKPHAVARIPCVKLPKKSQRSLISQHWEKRFLVSKVSPSLNN
jgi:hypothetical protein